jgi:hypothetical protein
MSEQMQLDGFKSTIVEKQNFDDMNKGKPLLNEDDEYVFRLTKVPHVIKTQVIRDNKDGSKTTEIAMKAVCDFEDGITKNIVTAFLRIDKLNFSDDESYRSAVIRFFQKIGSPLTENKCPNWTDKFVVGMRFRGRVKVKPGVDKDGQPITRYYLDIPTVRKLLPTDFENTASSVHDKSPLMNAQIIVKGCSTPMDAISRLTDAKVTSDVIAAFIKADKEGIITYPC